MRFWIYVQGIYEYDKKFFNIQNNVWFEMQVKTMEHRQQKQTPFSVIDIYNNVIMDCGLFFSRITDMLICLYDMLFISVPNSTCTLSGNTKRCSN